MQQLAGDPRPSRAAKPGGVHHSFHASLVQAELWKLTAMCLMTVHLLRLSDSKRSWSRHLLSKLKRDKNPRDAAAAAAASDSPQNVEPQLDAAQTTAAPNGLRKHLAKSRKPFSHRFRYKGELLSSDTEQPSECYQGCVEGAEPSHSIQSSGVMQQQQQQAQVRSVSMTAVAASALEPHVQGEQQRQQGLSGQIGWW